MALSWPSVPVGIFFRSWLNSSDGRRPPLQNSRKENVRQVFDCDALLFHRIALAQGNGVSERQIRLAERLEINRHAKRRSNFILAPISAADRPALIVKNKHVRSKKIDNLLRLRHKRLLVFQEREYGAFDRRDSRMK